MEHAWSLPLGFRGDMFDAGVEAEVDRLLSSSEEVAVGGLMRWLALWPPRAWYDGKDLLQTLHL